MPVEIIHDEPAETYHAQAGEYLSSHLLADFRACPLLYRQRVLGIVEDVDRPAYILGRAAHTLILEGEWAFKGRYRVGGPINEKTGEPYGPQTKAVAEWKATLPAGVEVLTQDQLDLVTSMRAGVAGHDKASRLIDHGYGVAETVIRGEMENRGETIRCQARIDWLANVDNTVCIVDLKTCDNLTWFESDAKRFGYVYQLAFYRWLAAEAEGKTPPVYIVAVEKKAPFRCGVWRIADDLLDQAHEVNADAMQRLLTAQRLDHWPTGYEAVRIMDSV